MKKYIRTPLEVDAKKYELGKQMEDGFEMFNKVVTNGWIVTEGLVKTTLPDGRVVCPFVQNRRGLTFIKEGDYIIYEDGEKHVCGADKFPYRFKVIE